MSAGGPARPSARNLGAGTPPLGASSFLPPSSSPSPPSFGAAAPPLSPWTRPWGPLALLALAAFAAFALGWRRPASPAAVAADWQGWRQADTHAMARSQAFEAFDPTTPRIDWRGDGPGYVEAEMPLYPALVSVPLRFFGDGVLAGQLVSLVCVLLACALLYRALARRFGGCAAFYALLAVLTGPGALVISTSLQPDPLAFLAFTVAWLSFLAYLDSGDRDRPAALFTWILSTALAGLIKPTTLELGLAQGVYVLLAQRRALRDPKLWLGWLLVLALVAVYLLYARQLYQTYGNTFGVLSGGDSKLPAIERLLEPLAWRELGRYAVSWGVTWPSLLAIAILLVAAALRLLRARTQLSQLPGLPLPPAFGPEVIALAVAALALDLLAFRYTAGPFGTHYHLPHAVLGATLVARAVSAIRPIAHAASSIVADPAPLAAMPPSMHAPRWLARLLLVGFLALSGWSAYRAVQFLRRLPPQPEAEMGLALSRLAPPKALVAVRARAERYSQEWKTVNNFEDPRVFYLSRTYGWLLPNDLVGAEAVARLEELARRGARFYVHVHQIEIDAALRAFLDANAERVFASAAGEIYAFTGAFTGAPQPLRRK